MVDWLIFTLTRINQFAQMRQQGMGSLTTELSFEVIQVQGPHEGTAKIHVLHVLDLRSSNQRDQHRIL